MEDKVSVIIIIYKVEKYLRECLESVVTQTYKNLEIICVVGKGDAECEKIADEYEREDRRFRVIHTENRGLSAARNTGLNHMTGALIAFLDSDDVFHPDMIKTLTDILLQKI